MTYEQFLGILIGIPLGMLIEAILRSLSWSMVPHGRR